MPVLPDPEPFLPDNYAATIATSLAASASFLALHYALLSLPKEQSDAIKESVISAWKRTWRAKFQEDMTLYTKLLSDGRVEGAIEQLAAPEELQGRFDRTLKEVESSARAALWPEAT
jgi:hypothetical protein